MASSTLASYASMTRDFELLVARAAETDRNVANIVGPNWNNLREYGCWCYFHADGSMPGEVDARQGKGKPIDTLDSLCRELSWGYDCLIMETEDNNIVDTNGDPCVPWEVFYLPGTGGGLPGLHPTCEGFNANECARKACKIEGSFVLQLFSLLFDPNALNDAYRPSNGFDQNDNCPTVPGGGPADRECCGAYPNRKPYHTRNGNNECCTDNADFTKVFQPLTHVCCTTHVVEVGTDCQ